MEPDVRSRLGLDRFRISQMAVALMALHIISYLMQYWVQEHVGNRIFDLSNLYSADGEMRIAT
jgi:hypothetical protein